MADRRWSASGCGVRHRPDTRPLSLDCDRGRSCARRQGPWSAATEIPVTARRHLLETPLFWGALALSPLLVAGASHHLYQQRRRRRELHLQQAQKLESISLLASGVAHDLNNVLQGIISGAESLRLRVADNPETQRDIDTVLNAADQGVGLSQETQKENRHGWYSCLAGATTSAPHQYCEFL